MHQKRRIEILPVEVLGHAGNEDDREFQSLALVDRHDPHAVSFLAASAGSPKVPAILAKPGNIDQEAE
ncbi:hypothetical protein D3C71_1612480 [compost metagenome]